MLYSGTFHNGLSKIRTASIQQTNNMPPIDFAMQIIHFNLWETDNFLSPDAFLTLISSFLTFSFVYEGLGEFQVHKRFSISYLCNFIKYIILIMKLGCWYMIWDLLIHITRTCNLILMIISSNILAMLNIRLIITIARPVPESRERGPTAHPPSFASISC